MRDVVRAVTHDGAVIVFASHVTDAERYAQGARAWTEVVAEPSSTLIEIVGHDTPGAAYCEVLDEYFGDDAIDAIVFIEEGADLAGSPGFAASLRSLLADESVTVVRIRSADDPATQAFALSPWAVQNMRCTQESGSVPVDEFSQLAEAIGNQVLEMTVVTEPDTGAP